MRSKKLIKLIVGISLIAVMAISIPLISGCAAPVPTPTPEPGEPTPTPEPEPAAEEPHWTLKIQACQGPGVAKEYYGDFFKEPVERMSGGRITIEWFSAGELMPPSEEVAAVQAGTLEMDSWWPPNGTATELHTIAGNFPFITRSPLEFQTLLDYRGLGEIFKEAYEELGGIHYLGYSLHDPSDIASTKPIRTMEDFQGLILQIPAAQAPPFEALGAKCVWIPLEDLYMGAKTGMVDAFFGCGASELRSWGLAEVFEYLIVPPTLDPWCDHILINEDVWNSLPADLQAILEYGVVAHSSMCQLIRFEGESRDREVFEVCRLDDECIDALYEASMDSLDEVAKKSPRCAEAVRIIKAYNAEIEAAQWHR